MRPAKETSILEQNSIVLTISLRLFSVRSRYRRKIVRKNSAVHAVLCSFVRLWNDHQWVCIHLVQHGYTKKYLFLLLLRITALPLLLPFVLALIRIERTEWIKFYRGLMQKCNSKITTALLWKVKKKNRKRPRKQIAAREKIKYYLLNDRSLQESKATAFRTEIRNFEDGNYVVLRWVAHFVKHFNREREVRMKTRDERIVCA